MKWRPLLRSVCEGGYGFLGCAEKMWRFWRKSWRAISMQNSKLFPMVKERNCYLQQKIRYSPKTETTDSNSARCWSEKYQKSTFDGPKIIANARNFEGMWFFWFLMGFCGWSFITTTLKYRWPWKIVDYYHIENTDDVSVAEQYQVSNMKDHHQKLLPCHFQPSCLLETRFVILDSHFWFRI